MVVVMPKRSSLAGVLLACLVLGCSLQGSSGTKYTDADIKRAYNDGYADGMQSVLRNYGASLDIDKGSSIDVEIEDQQGREPGTTGAGASCSALRDGLSAYGMDNSDEEPQVSVTSDATQLGRFTLLWPTTIYTAEFDLDKADVLPAVLGAVHTHHKADASSSDTDDNDDDNDDEDVIRGWVSDEMLEWRDDTVRALEAAVLSHFKAVLEADNPGSTTSNRVNVLLQMWSTVLEDGGFELPVQHAGDFGAHWTGKLVLDASTTLVLMSKDASPAQGWKSSQHRVALSSGDIAIFPADIVHFTLPAPPAGLTSITFNIKVISESPDAGSPGVFCANCIKSVLV
ncbi:hypothetical protein PTSG_04646 [Salpingoeca rosetta]|uniref:Uncharacterized protein n=1 Tax=Salpingoeca rosetta (strain ATCC 50818 / BSB-021) TaxID=946362 RepID=F2U811_SALR5|nr:uncharacterized protein PTSG_04646 [Salpingoeca rosetta]EGD72916.1 hypothetical protein PTSG_04646 [Salpingoeca rosetta]|eukprot:XP_004994738.1 hypothetical protein PTSG_04646 [Salpingoeca rosetta]